MSDISSSWSLKSKNNFKEQGSIRVGKFIEQEHFWEREETGKWVADEPSFQSKFHRAKSQGSYNIGQNYDQQIRIQV